MGRPAHYSLDIVVRCRSLLTHLVPHVLKGLPDDSGFGGPLSTTLLLALSGPMIALPVERIVKPADDRDVVADDRPLNAGLSEEVNKLFDGTKKFSACPFLAGTDWRLVRGVAPFNIADWGNDDVFEQLAGDAGKTTLADATAKFMMLHLRNAIAHGGILYLDKNGRLNNHAAAMLGFVSARLDKGKVQALNIARVSEADFEKFLLAWSDWVGKSGVGDAVSSSPALAA